jgi:hypothetical protein
LQRLEAALVRGPTEWGFPTHLWTLQRIVTVIWKVCHVRKDRNPFFSRLYRSELASRAPDAAGSGFIPYIPHFRETISSNYLHA